MSPTLSGGGDSFGDRQFMVITSEKQARVVALPSQNCVYRLQITDTDYVVRSEIISLKGRSIINDNSHYKIERYTFFFFVIFIEQTVCVWFVMCRRVIFWLTHYPV